MHIKKYNTQKIILLILFCLNIARCQSFSFFSNSSDNPAKIFKIRLNPARADRTICECTEECLAFEICQALQTKLVAAHDQIQVTLTREPGEESGRIQIASNSNQAKTNLFLSLHVYHECGPKPTINIFYYTQQRFCSQLTNFTNLSFINYSNAYLLNCDQTINWGHKIYNYLAQNQKSQFIIAPLLGMPFKPLAGIQAPALGIEIGLKNSAWQLAIAPITEAILLCILPTL